MVSYTDWFLPAGILTGILLNIKKKGWYLSNNELWNLWNLTTFCSFLCGGLAHISSSPSLPLLSFFFCLNSLRVDCLHTHFKICPPVFSTPSIRSSLKPPSLEFWLVLVTWLWEWNAAADAVWLFRLFLRKPDLIKHILLPSDIILFCDSAFTLVPGTRF